MNSLNEESCAKYYLDGPIFSLQTTRCSFNVQLFGQQLSSPTFIPEVSNTKFACEPEGRQQSSMISSKEVLPIHHLDSAHI